MVELGRIDAGVHLSGALLLLPTPNGSLRQEWMDDNLLLLLL
jgi:hypothetical protein